MHATALNALTEWGRVHEVRRSQPRLSGPLIQIFGAGRDPLLASVTGLYPTTENSSAVPDCSSSRGPFGLFSRWITVLGALRCTPGSVANPLNRLGRFIAAFESGPVVIRQGVSLKSGGRRPFAVAVCRCDGLNLQLIVTGYKLFGCGFLDLKLSLDSGKVVVLNCGHGKARVVGRVMAI